MRCCHMNALREILLVISLMASAIGMAQELRTDSLPIHPTDSVAAYLRPVDGMQHVDGYGEIKPFLSYTAEYVRSRQAVQMAWALNHKELTITPETASIASWQGGDFSAIGSSQSMPGLMGIESGRLQLQQSFGRLTLNAYASADKYAYFRGLQTSYGFGGTLSYRLSNRWSITLFGAYYTATNALTPAMAGYMSVPNFGGYVTYDINDHWGINVGAQAYRSTMTNSWEAQPIVMPYYKINGKAAIGVDVGGILYNVLKNNSSNRHNNPVIGPPTQGPPPVAPRPDKH